MVESSSNSANDVRDMVSLSIKPEVDEMVPTDIVEMLSPSSS